MKYLKLFVTVFAMAIAMNVSAQSKTTAKSKTTTTTTAAKAKTTTTAKSTATAKPAAAKTTTTTAAASKPAAKKSASYSGGFTPLTTVLLESKIGGCHGTGGFGENIVLEREFHKYIAWDIFSLDFSCPFNTGFLTIGVKTGIRGYTPRFWEDRMRGFSSLALGYDCGILTGSARDAAKSFGYQTEWHGLGLSWGIGVEMMDHFQLGYVLEYNSAMKSTSHFARITYKF